MSDDYFDICDNLDLLRAEIKRLRGERNQLAALPALQPSLPSEGIRKAAEEILRDLDVDWMPKGDVKRIEEIISRHVVATPAGGTRVRVQPRSSFTPPESCADCAKGVPFNEHGHHVKESE